MTDQLLKHRGLVVTMVGKKSGRLDISVIKLEAQGPCIGHRSIISNIAVFYYT